MHGYSSSPPQSRQHPHPTVQPLVLIILHTFTHMRTRKLLRCHRPKIVDLLPSQSARNPEWGLCALSWACRKTQPTEAHMLSHLTLHTILRHHRPKIVDLQLSQSARKPEWGLCAPVLGMQQNTTNRNTHALTSDTSHHPTSPQAENC